MIGPLKRLFGKTGADAQAPPGSAGGDDIHVATCAILLEMANIDGEFTEQEQIQVIAILKDRFQLSDELARGLIEATRDKLEHSLDLWQFTNQINQNYSRAEKLRIIEAIWTVVLIDGILDQHEDYLARKLTKLLRLSHKDMIDAKLRARSELQSGA